MDDGKNVSRETSFAQCKRSNLHGFIAAIAMNMATIRVIVPQKKKMRGTQMSEVEVDENEDGTASAQLRQDGTESTQSRQTALC
jgi:hypothetical protein